MNKENTFLTNSDSDKLSYKQAFIALLMGTVAYLIISSIHASSSFSADKDIPALEGFGVLLILIVVVLLAILLPFYLTRAVARKISGLDVNMGSVISGVAFIAIVLLIMSIFLGMVPGIEIIAYIPALPLGAWAMTHSCNSYLKSNKKNKF